MKSPGTSKPAHQYGQDMDEWDAPAVGEVPALPWDDPEVMVRDIKQAVRDIEGRGRPRVFGEDET